MMTKKDLRKIYQEKRNMLTSREIHEHLAGMIERFRDIPIPEEKIVFSYKAMVERKEVASDIFEQFLQDENEVLQFCYPKVDFVTFEMQAYLENENLEWEDAAFGLRQPASGQIVEPGQIGCVFVPLLAFDLKGYRLGYGKGFYDRFLSKCKPDTLKIGFSWFDAEPILPEIHHLDVPLNYCVTPQRLYVF